MLVVPFNEGTNVVYGLGPVRRIINLPSGVLKVRVRQRLDDLTRVFLKFADRIERWEILNTNKGWKLEYCSARNFSNFPGKTRTFICRCGDMYTHHYGDHRPDGEVGWYLVEIRQYGIMAGSTVHELIFAKPPDELEDGDSSNHVTNTPG